MNEKIKLLFSGDFAPITNTNAPIIDEQILQIIHSYDLHITNLETPLTRASDKIKKSGPHLKSKPEAIKKLIDAGVNIACLANNHIFDYGEQGILDTIEICEKNGIETIGIVNRPDNRTSYLIKDIRNQKVGFLNYCETEFSVREKGKLGANGFDCFKCYYEIKDLRKKCDYLILIFHGGNEMYTLPNPWMKKLFHFFIDLGVDTVICHHSHVISGYEIYQNKPIFYGIGNFYFPEDNNEEDWYFGLLIDLTLDINKISFELIPINQKVIFNEIKMILCEKYKKDEIILRIDYLSKLIQDDKLLKKEWEKFILNNQKGIIKNLLNLTKFEKLLLRLPYFEEMILKTSKLLVLYNLVTCESHHSLVRDVLKKKINID